MNLVNYRAKDQINDLLLRMELGGHHCPSMDEISDILKDCADAMGTRCEGCRTLAAEVESLELQLYDAEERADEYFAILEGVRKAVDDAQNVLDGNDPDL
jgi:hypothetical protein